MPFLQGVVLALAALVLVGLKRVVNYYRDPLRDVPGPFWARFSRLWLLAEAIRKRNHETLTDLHNHYGPVVRLSPDYYSIADLDVARTLYGIRTSYEKADWYAVFTSPGSATIFTDRDNKHYATTRRKFAASYSMSNIVHYEEHFDRCLDSLCKRLKSLAEASQECQFAKWFRLFAYDSTAEITFGKSFGGVETGEDREGILKITRASVLYGIIVGVYPHLHKWIYKLVPSGKGERAAEDYTWKQVLERQQSFSSGEGMSSLVDFWLRQNAQSGGEKMALSDIRLGIAANIGAGADTTSQALCAIIYLVCTHPPVLEKLRAEIAHAMSQEDTTKNGILTHRATNEMPYLQAVFKESLRLYPPVGAVLPRKVPQGGANLAGHHFREGLNVGINLWPTRHNPKYYGEDAKLFRPERWLGDSDEVKRNEHYYMPFSMGPRSCIGKNIAQLEITKSVSKLLHDFDVTVKHPAGGNLRFTNYVVLETDSLVCDLKPRH